MGSGSDEADVWEETELQSCTGARVCLRLHPLHTARLFRGEHERKRNGGISEDSQLSRCRVEFQDVVCILQPIVFRFLLAYFAQPQQVSFRGACILVAVLVSLNICNAFIGPQIVFRFIKCGMTWQSATCGLLYKKMTRLSHAARASLNGGHIIDVIGSDTEKLDWVIILHHDFSHQLTFARRLMFL